MQYEENAIAIDIETVPDLSKIDMLPEPEIDSRLKDPEKIEAVKEKKREQQIAEMGLSPYTGRVCAYAVYGENVSISDFISEIENENEIALISAIIAYLREANPLVTFNGISFDIPFIYSRAMLLGVNAAPYSVSYWSRRYSVKPHFDVRMVLSQWNSYAKGNLDFYGKMVLGEEKEEPDYTQFIEMIENGKGNEIAKSCLQHTELTFNLFQKIEPYFA